MLKKNTILVIVLLVLVVCYAYFFTDWFKPRTIKIFYTTRQLEHYRSRHDLPYILFVMEGRYRLTELKVVPLADFQSNSMTPPLWHLVSPSNSIPIKVFEYGQHIHGMKPVIEGEDPQDLQTNLDYLLIVAAGNAKGSVDFKLK
jgi:hypothetical protein